VKKWSGASHVSSLAAPSPMAIMGYEIAFIIPGLCKSLVLRNTDVVVGSWPTHLEGFSIWHADITRKSP